MNKQGRLSFWFLLTMVALGLITTAIEYSNIPSEQLTSYLAIRIPLLLSGIPLAFLFRKKPFSSVGHFLFGMLIVFYTSHAQWYRPFYEYTFFQALVVYTLLLYPPKKVFLTVLTLGSAIFLAVYIYRFDDVVINSKTTLEENYTGIIAFSLTLYGIFKVFSEHRAFKEQALARFGYLGQHSASILHDLKGTVAIPRIYTELAEEELAKGNIEGAKHRLQETLNSLEAMQTIIARLNQISQMTQFKTEEVDLKEVMQEVQSVLRLKLQNVAVNIRGESYIDANRSFVFSFLLNLVMNSVEVFETRKIAHPEIEILLETRRLVFTDNGGGFDPKILEKIESGVSASSKMDASGLGLFLLIDGIRNIGGKVFCSNTQQGACVVVQFKA